MPAAPSTSTPLNGPYVYSRPAGTEVEQFLQFATPESRKVLTVPMLQGRLAQGSVAGALNDQIRFRLEGSGDPSTRRFVPDSLRAAELVKTPAGQKLIHQLRVAASQADYAKPGKDELKGFILAPTELSAVASNVLGRMQSTMRQYKDFQKDMRSGDAKVINSRLSNYYGEEIKTVPDVIAWNESGWITFLPEAARMMLVSVGAYTPKRGDAQSIRDAANAVDSLISTPAHEVEHAVTAPGDDYGVPENYSKTAWMEEGIADTLSYTPRLRNKLQHKLGINSHIYAGQLAHRSPYDMGWGTYKPQAVSEEVQAKADENIDNMYTDAAVSVRKLLNLAGVGLASNAGVAQAQTLLQSKALRFVPGDLADAIIKHHQLDPSVRETLRQRIIHVNEKPGNMAALRREFGI